MRSVATATLSKKISEVPRAPAASIPNGSAFTPKAPTVAVPSGTQELYARLHVTLAGHDFDDGVLRKIGARPEGVLRFHTLMHDGRYRDTPYFNILESEWPLAKGALRPL